jgi:NAD(P)-dependent dehydrogenase (short-subunit alcohol dehydrogenase family)
VSWSIGEGLEGSGVLVTGAAGGIGRAVAEAFAACGARVCACDLEAGAIARVVAELPGGPHAAVATDLADVASHAALLARTVDELGRLDVLAHLAAIARRQGLDEVTEADWDAQHDVNLKSAFFLARAAAQVMRGQGRGGRIVLFSSQGWWTGGFGGSVVYNAAKGGIVSMTRGLARTLGPDGILVNAVAPGLVDTPMLRAGLTEEALASLVADVPLGRLATPDEIAGTVVYLASDHGSYVTGATVNVSGGFVMY